MRGEIDLGKWLLGAIIAGVVVWGLFTAVQKFGLLEYLVTPPEETEKVEQIIREREIIREVERPTTEGVEPAEVRPIETLKMTAKDKYTMADLSSGKIHFYDVGADVSDPNTKPLDTITISSGTGNTTNMVIHTNTEYDVYFNGSSTHYDEKIKNWKVSYSPDTGKGFLFFDDKSYYSAVNVGSFVDVDTLPEYETGWNESGTDTIYYDKSAMGGSGWIKVDIGNSEANSELHDVVMCFLDSDGDLEGDEVTSITASFVSGSTAINIPSDLTTYWTDAAGTGAATCFEIAPVLGSAEKARWQFTITFDEGNLDTTEEFKICWDDGGDYKAKEYPSRNAKATAECLTIGVQD